MIAPLVALLAASIASSGPPPATASSGGVTERMALGSFCWTGKGHSMCADSLPPRPKNRLVVGEGDTVRFHLRLEPKAVFLTRRGREHSVRLKARRNTSWVVDGHPRFVDVFVTPRRGGDVSYTLALRVR
jgi:hypothetical protein